MRVVIPSCDEFRALWRPMLQLMTRYWVECPWPRVIVANEHDMDLHEFDAQVAVTGADESWGVALARGLELLDDEWVLLVLDDFFFTYPVDTQVLMRLASFVVEHQVDYLRVAPTPPCTKPFDGTLVGEHEYGHQYRCSLQPAFWRRTYLMDQCRKYGDPWSFELENQGEPQAIHLSVQRPVRPLSYLEASKRRAWTVEGLYLLVRERINPDYAAGGALGDPERIFDPSNSQRYMR